MAESRYPLLPGTGRGRALGATVALALLPAIYFGVVPAFMHRIDDDVTFAPASVPSGASRAVAVAAALVEREIDRNGWVANDPFFYPTAILDNMPNYQTGIVAAVSRFVLEMSDQIGRTRGSSQVDADLEKAAGLLKYPGTIWIFDTRTSWLPTTPAEDQYRAARKALESYNQRLSEGRAVFDRRADNLLGTLERVAADLGSVSAALDTRIAERGWLAVDFESDNLFYGTKGRLYAYLLILRGLRADFEAVVRDRETGAAWDQMLRSLEEGATMSPAVVLNGAPDGIVAPNHIAAIGFYLLRARTQLREITTILQK